MPSVADIVLFSRNQAEVEATKAAAEGLLSGSGAQTVQNFYSDGSGQFHAGIWSGEVGSWKVRYTEHEFCTLLAGRVKLTDESGASMEIAAGEHFVIPAGFNGVWTVLEPARKTYVIFEQAK